MKYFIKSLIITALISINSCVSNIKRMSYDVAYNINLEVAKGKEKKQTVEVKRKMYIDEDEKTLKYKDQFIQTEWQLDKEGFWFSIKNNTELKIKIILNEIYFSDDESGSYKIGYKNLDQFDKETIILPESFYENYILPYGNSKESYFPARAIFLANKNQEKNMNIFTKEIRDRFYSTPVQILIPIEIEGQIYDYRFLFSFNDINLTDK